jgi:choline dehydrogenase-like flavoprotein
VDKVLDAVDVLVVGSGAIGSAYADVLATAGKSVLVLEQGRERKLSDLYSSQIWARRLKWASPLILETGPHSISPNFNAGHGYGGAAMHQYATWPRFHVEDFRERTLYGRSLDWPFEYSELRPFYDQVQRDVGISGDAAKEIWRPPGEEYPLPPVLVTNHGRVINRGFEALNLRTAPLPSAVLSQPYRGRKACLWDGWCDAGCPIGALANPLVTYLPRAEQAGARLRANARVTRVLTDKSGTRITGVEYFTPSGQRVHQPASVVVLCAFTIENTRILLNSRSAQHPNGLSNSSGLLGKYLMAHPSITLFGMFDEDMENYLGTTGGQLLCQDGYGKTGDPSGAFGSRQWLIGGAIKPNDLLGIAMSKPFIFGDDLHDFMRRGSKFLGTMNGLCEDEPVMQNRIELADQNDEFGMPLARIVYDMSTEGRRLGDTAASEGSEIFKAAGAQEVWHTPLFSAHIMGGTISGTSPAHSVVNSYCQSHDLNNLFVGGSSVFPTSAAVNPTFTALAVAMRSAQYMLHSWSDLKKLA